MRDVAVGLAGFGRFARLHGRVLADLPAARVAAICDRDPAALAAAQALFPDASCFADFDAMLAGAALDAVDVVTDESVHGSQVMACLERDLPVFVEKPLATSTAEAEAIERLAGERGLPVLVGYVSRFDHRYALVARAVADGRLGRVVSVSARRGFSRSWFAGFGTRVHPVFESMIHDIDLALWYLGAKVRSVYGQTVASAGPGSGVPDVMAAVLTTETGSLATLQSAWLAPANSVQNLPSPPLDPLELEGTIEARLDIVGTLGTASVSLDDGLRLVGDTSHASSTGLWPEVHGRVAGALRSELEHFLACVRERRPSDIVPLAAGVAGVRIAEAIVASAERDEAVTP